MSPGDSGTGILPREMIRRIRRIEIRTRRLVNESLAGEYHSVFRGRGMEFSDVREYQSGDDIRTIDWNVTSRMGHPYVKKFVEERELTVALVVDASASRDFGSGGRGKGEITAEISGLLAFSAIQNKDRVGLLRFTDQIERYVPPKKGRTHVLRVIRELLYGQAASRGTDIGMAMEFAMGVFRKRAVMFLISDFLADGYEKPLRRAAKKHDLIAIVISDPREFTLPDVGLLELEDAENFSTMVVDTSDPRTRAAYAKRATTRKQERDKLFGKLGIDSIDLSTDRPYDLPLIRFFATRARRARR